jgi:virginiamycin B lyase
LVGLCPAVGCTLSTASSELDAGGDGAGSAHLVLAITNGETNDFGRVPTNGRAFRPCTLTNVGTGPTTIDAVSVQGSADFAVQSSDCALYGGNGFPAGATCSFMTAFTPSAEVSETGTVVVMAADGEKPSIVFTGGGASPVPITEYPIPTANSGPWTMSTGSDGALWFAEDQAHQIGRVTTAGAFTEYPVPFTNAALETVAPGPDGALWFVDGDNNQIVRVAVDGTFSAYPVPTLNDPVGIAVGPDGALWVTAYSGSVGRMTTAGLVTDTFSIPTLDAGAGDITAGPGQSLWFTEYDAGAIASIDLNGTITEFKLSAPPQGPGAITAGPDGQVWFVDTGLVGAITTLGAVTLHPAPYAGGAGSAIISGPDGALWFTEPADNYIGRVSTNGDFIELRPPTANAMPTGIAVGTDGAIWFTERSASQIGRLLPGSF